jgi:hypothetical protein
MMKILTHLLLISAISVSSSALAHSTGHAKVNAAKAIEIAQTSAKTLTFKDLGMSLGKIDQSWNNVDKQYFKVVEQGESGYIVKAFNGQNNQTVYFKISEKGEIEDVKDAKAFSQAHAHSH